MIGSAKRFDAARSGWIRLLHRRRPDNPRHREVVIPSRQAGIAILPVEELST
jgi:hypothetical protein